MDDITEIAFDESEDRIVKPQTGAYLRIDLADGGELLVEWKNFDSFIEACHRARALWGTH